MRQFMELQAVFALVIVCGELPSGLLSDLWGRKKKKEDAATGLGERVQISLAIMAVRQD